MVVTSRWWVARDDFDTTVWSIVRPLALLAIVVAHIVCILLVKL